MKNNLEFLHLLPELFRKEQKFKLKFQRIGKQKIHAD